MAAAHRPPGSCCSHALRDYQHPPQGSVLGLRGGELEGGFAKPGRGRGGSSVFLAALGWLGNRSRLAGDLATTQWSSVSKSCQECPSLICTPEGTGCRAAHGTHTRRPPRPLLIPKSAILASLEDASGAQRVGTGEREPKGVQEGRKGPLGGRKLEATGEG